MNVLLAGAGIALRPDRRHGRHQPEFPNTDVSLVIGANDVVNPVAKTDPAARSTACRSSNVVDSKNTIVIKRGKGHRFRRHRERAVLRRQHAHAVRRRRRMASALVSELKRSTAGIEAGRYRSRPAF